MKINFDILKSNSLFKDMSTNEIEKILVCLNAKARRYKKGSIIYMAGESAENIGIIMSGSVQIIKEDYLGNRSIIASLHQSEMFGEVFACAGIKKSPVTVVSAADCEIMLFNFNKIITSCTSACVFHTKLIENMLNIIAKKTIILNQKVQLLSGRSIREKISSYLVLQMEKSNSDSFEIRLNRNELADFLCADRSALSRELSNMRKDGIIDFSGEKFKVLKKTH